MKRWICNRLWAFHKWLHPYHSLVWGCIPYFVTSEHTIVVLTNQDNNTKSRASKVIDDLKTIIAEQQTIQ